MVPTVWRPFSVARFGGACSVALIAATLFSFSAAPAQAEEDDKGGFSIFGLRIGGDDEDEPKKKPEPAPQQKQVEEEESDDGLSIFGVRLTGGDDDEEDASAPVKDPANTIILTLGLGYDSAADKTPDKTGEIAIRLLPKVAPNHAKRIKALVRKGYYNGKTFHRVVEGFMAQGGSPDGDGQGGAPGYPDLKAEFSNIKFKHGVVGMARTNLSDDTANAQFFIMYGRDFNLDGKYTVVGRVVRGMKVVEKLNRTAIFTAQGESPTPDETPDRIVSARVASDSR